MKPLFIRVLLVMLGSFLVVAVISGLLFKWVSHELDPGEDDLGELAERVAEEVVETYEEGDFQKFRQRLNREFRTRVWITDEAGNNPVPGPVPAEIAGQISDLPQVIPPYQNTAGRFFIFAQPVDRDEGDYRVIMTSRRPLFPHHRQHWRVLFPIIITLGGLCLASALLSYWILYPIREIRRTSRRISGGNLDTRVPEKISLRKDAFGELGRELNHMTDRVRQTVDNQNQLLRDVSHELRSPLTRIQVANSLLEQKHGQSNEVDRISAEITRLDNMIGDLMSLSRIKNMDNLDAGPVLLKPLLTEVIDNANFEFQSLHKSAELSHGQDITVAGNPELLSSLFENVLRNALRFSPENSRVEVTVKNDGTIVTIGIRDHGPGVSENELQRIFDPFYRSDQSREPGSGNHGIGLALARTICHLHGGDITAHNHVDGGLDVHVTLPLA